MITIENRYWLCNDKLVFFPNKREIQQLIKKMAFNDVLRIRQTNAYLYDEFPGLIYREMIRTNCIDLTKDIKYLYHDMDAKSCRYEIRKAEKIGERLQIRSNDDISQKDFWGLYNNFVKLKGYTRPLTAHRFSNFIPISDIFVIYFKERPICGHLLLCDPTIKRVRLLFSASTRLNSCEDAALVSPLNRYLHWHEFQTYKGNNMEVYDFGGLSLHGPIARFKKSFGGAAVEEYGYVFTRGVSAAIGKVAYRSYLSLIKMRQLIGISAKSKLRKIRQRLNL